MADSKIPVEIEVRLDERSVGVSMESLKSRVKSQGREIGKSLSGAFSDISFMSDAVMKAEREKDKFIKKQIDADRVFNNTVRNEAKKTADAQIAEAKRASAELERVRKSLGLNVMGQAPIKLFGSMADAMKRTEASAVSLNKQMDKFGSLGLNVMGQAPIKLFGSMADAMKRVEASAKNHLTLWERINAPLKKVALLTTELTRAFFGLSLAITGISLPAIIGVKFLKELEDAKMGVAGIVTSMMSINGVALTAEQGISVADNAIKELTKSAHKYGLSVSDVVTTFRAITASGTSANMTLGEIRDLATIGTLAVKGIGLDSRQVVQEVRDLVAGGIQPASSTLATALGLRDKDIKAAKESAEGLYKFLIGKLQGFAEVAAYARDKTMSGILDSITIKIQTAFADEKLFGGIKDFLKRISDSIGTIDKLTGDIKLTDEFKEMAEGYLWFIESIGMLVKSVVYGLGDMLVWIKKMKDEFGAVGDAATGAAGTVFTAWLILPKKIIASLTPLSGFFTGFGTNAAVASTTAFSTQWVKSASGFQKVGLVLGTALRAGVVAGLTGFITYELTKEIIEANDPLKKFTLQLVGGFLIAGSKITEVFEKSVAWVTYLIEKSMDVMKRGIKGILDAASSAAKFVGLGDISSRFSGASAAIDINPVNLVSPEETRDKSLAAASEKHNKYVGDLVRSYGELTYGMTEAGKAQQKINEEQLRSTNAYIKSAAALDELGKSLGTAESKKKAYKSLVEDIKSKRKELITSAEAQKKAHTDPEQIANIDKNIAGYKKQAEEMLKLAKAKYQASLVDKDAIKLNKKEFKDALEIEKVFADQQDMLVQEGAKTYLEAYNLKINKIKELSKQNETNIKWEERRNEAYKVVSDYLTKSNTQLNKESEQREANTTATLKYGAAVETSGAALLMEQYAREGFLNSGFKELALSNVLAQSRNDLSKIHEKSVKEQIDSQKELDELVAESSLIFLENEKQKSEFKMQETLKRINAEREEAKKSLELNLKLRMNAGPLSPQEYENYLKTKEAIDKSFMDREETTRKIFNQRVKNAELKDAKETVDKIEGTFKEAFMNIAESGTSGWRSMLNKFKSDFKKNIIEYIYKELAKPFVLNVIAQVTGAMGMSGVSQAASSMVGGSSGGGVGSLLNIGSQGASSLYNLAAAPGTASMMLAGNFAMSGVGQALGLSTATAPGYMAPVYEAGKLISAGTGTAAGGLTTAGSALTTAAAAAPYVLAALAIADAVGAFGKRGGPQQGQYGSLGAEGYKSSFTMSGGDALGNQALAEVAYGQAANLLKMAGKDIAGLTIGQGYKLDPEGSAAGLAYRNISLNGRTVTGGTFDGNNGAQWVGGNSDGAGAANYLGKLTNEEIRKLVDAIGDSGLSETIEKLSANFTDLNDAIGKYTVAQAQQKALLSVVMTEDEKKTLQLADAQKVLDSTFASLGMSVPSTAAGFRDLINGLDLTTKAGQDALTKLSDVSGAYLTVANNAVELANKAAEEAKAAQQEQYGWQIKLDIAQGKYTEQQADRLSIWNAAANDSTRAIISQVWALEDQKVALEAQKVATDAATESLKEMQAVAMEGVDNAFGELVSAYESEISAKESLIDKTKDYIRQLKDFSRSLALGELSTLNPLGKYEAAKSAFDVVSQRAMSGDSAAIEQLQGVSEAYLQASREYYASNVQYADDYNKVQSAISKTVNVAEQQVRSMDAQLITMRQQLSSLTRINESTKSVESAITRLQTALLEAVRVGNIGDVSEQAKTASGLIKGGAGELYNPLTDTWSNKGQSATTSQIRDWGAKILNEQGPMALYEATKSVGLSMSSVNVIAGWKAGTAEDWAKANNLPTFANGGFVKPGWAMVGERGPELVNFATQARVYTADQTSRMISGSGDNEVYLQQVIAELQALIRQNGAASQAMIAELQQVKAELEDLRSRTRLRDGTNG